MATPRNPSGRSLAAGNRQRINEGRAEAVRLAAGSRSRGEVYRGDVEHTGSDAYDQPLPPARTIMRRALVNAIRDLRREGKTLRAIAAQLGYEYEQINYLCNLHKIRKPEGT